MLGLTQLEISVLLNVSRVHYAMYELGQRKLPPAATIRLANLLTNLQAIEHSVLKKSDTKMDQSVIEHLLRLLKENEYQLATNSRKIAALLKKRESTQRLLLLSAVLKRSNAFKTVADATAMSISAKALKAANNDKTHQLLTLEIRQEVLEHEKNLLKMKILSAQGKP